jgi:hypothetical protein
MDEWISLFNLESIFKILLIFVSLLSDLWYILAGGIVLGSVISVFVPLKSLSEVCQERHWMKAVFYASLLGVISPLGSYAVIPLFSTLIYSRFPLAPLMAFLITSPLISPFDFLNTWGILGAKMALARVISTFLIGIGFGTLFHYLSRKGFSPSPASIDSVRYVGKAMAMVNPNPEESRWKTLGTLIWKTSKYSTKYFLLAILLAGVTNTFIPQDWIVRTLGGSNFSVLLAAAMGLPLYMCGGGAVPLIWQLMRMGMDQGAALAFFIAGPATRIAPMVTVFLLVRQKAFFLYFIFSFLGAILFGSLYRFL